MLALTHSITMESGSISYQSIVNVYNMKNLFQVIGRRGVHKHPSLHKKSVQQGFNQPAAITPPNPHTK
jgi:hypothetical protein